MCCLIKYIHTNYFTYNKIKEVQTNNDDNLITQNYYNHILSELSEQCIIKYVYMKDNVSGLLMIKYTELNFVPLYETIRNHPLSHGYGDFEMAIILLYNDITKRKNIIDILNISRHWNIPREISVYICQIFWNIIK